MIYLQLLWTFMKIGMFSIGGGYAAMALIQQQVVDIRQWLTMTQFSDVITISEMTPGPIVVNAATFVGIRVAGVPGAIIATLGSILPSCVIMLILAYVYYRFRGLGTIKGILGGLRPAIVAVIFSAGITILTLALYGQRTLPAGDKTPDLIALGIFIAAFIVLKKWKVSPIWIMAGSGLIGTILYLLIG